MPTTTARYTVKPRQALWQALRIKYTDAGLARRLGVSQPTVTRAVNGTLNAGASFIAAALYAFPESSFERLFEVRNA